MDVSTSVMFSDNLDFGARPPVDPTLQDRGDLQRQRHDRARAECRVPAPDQEAKQAVADGLLRARVWPRQQ